MSLNVIQTDTILAWVRFPIKLS